MSRLLRIGLCLIAALTMAVLVACGADGASSSSGSGDIPVGAATSNTPVSTGDVAADTTFTLTVTGPDGQKATQTVAVAAVAPAVITSFTAAKSILRMGSATTITGVFTGGSGSVDNGVGAVTTAVTKTTGNIAADTTFTLTVTNAAGDAVTATASVQAVAPPTITSFAAASAKVSKGTATTVTGVFAAGTGSVDNGVGAVTTEVAAATGNVGAKTTFKLTVTNILGDAVTATVDVDVKRELFVSSFSNAIGVVDEDATGAVVAKRTISGASTGLSGPRGLSILNGELFVANSSGHDIRVFDVTASGDVAPKRIISAAGSLIGISTFNGEIFAGDGASALNVWNTSDNGAIAAKRTVTGANTTLNVTGGTFVDDNEIYVGSFFPGGGIRVFPLAATGNVAPTRTIAVPTSNATMPLVSGNELFVSSPGAKGVTVLNKTTGAQLRQILGVNTGFGYVEQCVIIGAELLCCDYKPSSTVRVW